jgi:hypothetical protein
MPHEITRWKLGVFPFEILLFAERLVYQYVENAEFDLSPETQSIVHSRSLQYQFFDEPTFLPLVS